MAECHFWADVMLRQPRLRASRASCSKLARLESGLLQKKNQGLHCHSVGRYIFELFSCETDLKKKRMQLDTVLHFHWKNHQSITSITYYEKSLNLFLFTGFYGRLSSFAPLNTPKMDFEGIIGITFFLK